MRVFGLTAGFDRLAGYSGNHTEELCVKRHCSSGRCRSRRVALENAALVCEHCRISRTAPYRWKVRFNPRRTDSLEEHSRRPGRTRVPRHGTRLQRRVIEPREGYGWGKATGCAGRIQDAYQLERAVNMHPVPLEPEGLHASAGTLGMQDLTGDGLPDHYMKYSGDTYIQVKRNSWKGGPAQRNTAAPRR